MELLTPQGKITTLPDSCIVYNIGTPQWFHSEDILYHDWIHMTGDVADAMAIAGIEFDRVYTPGNAKYITAIIRQIELEVLTKPDNWEILTQLKLQELLLKLGRSCHEQDSVALKSATIDRLRQVRSQVFSQLEHPWTVEEMAALAYISPSRFHAIYRQAFGISPADDLIRARIDTAKLRLSGSKESLASLAESLGYRNVTHFCRQFKQYTGVTAGQFQRTVDL